MKFHFNKINYTKLIWLILAVFVLGSAQPVSSADRYKVGIVRIKFSSSPVDSKPFDDAVAGFQELLRFRQFPIDYKYIDLKYGESVSGAFQELRAFGPDLILTVGTDATIYTKKNFADIPIVFTMILDPIGSGVVGSKSSPGQNITGVSINISVEEQFRKLIELIPDLRNIGMLYDPKGVRGMSNKQMAESAANRLGLNLVARPISSSAEIVVGLEEALRASDALWAGPDLTIYNPQSAETIILTTLRYKKPFMAFDSYVRAGALVGLTCNYLDIGKQTGEIAIRILNGQNPGMISVEDPREKTFLIHKEAAKRIGVRIPDEFLEDAIVY